MRADDAVRAVDAGCAAVVVSNHGGRQLDGGPATLDALPAVADAVGTRAEVYVDGGVRWGSDVVKALALGARAVLVGRPILWGLAAAGEAGAWRVLEILREELSRAMALAGCPTLQSRFLVSQQLLEWGFAHFSKLKVVEAGQPISVEVQVSNGARQSVRPVAAGSLTYVVRNDEKKDLHVSFQLPTVVSAPIAKDQELGEIIVRDQQKVLDVIPAVSPVDVGSGSTRTLNP